MGRTKGASRRLTPASRPKTARQREATTKRRGELAELAFVYKAASLGFGVAKPYGDSERYDFILDSGSRLWRIQVKSTSTLLNGMYHVNSHRRINGGVVPYRPSEVDFMVACVLPEDAWFIYPDPRGCPAHQLAAQPQRLPPRPRPLRPLPRSLAPAAPAGWACSGVGAAG